MLCNAGSMVSYDTADMRINVILPGNPMTVSQAEELAQSLLVASAAVRSSVGVIISKKKSKSSGMTRYFTGRACVNGHLTERMVSNGACIGCLRQFRSSTPEARIKERRRISTLRKATPEKRSKRNKKERLRESQRIGRALRNRLGLAVNGGARAGSAVRDLGCTIEEFKTYISLKFQPGMSWENHGIRGWHFDHIRPLAVFDLSDRAQFLAASHFTNYQPLWADDNHKKSNRIIPIDVIDLAFARSVLSEAGVTYREVS